MLSIKNTQIVPALVLALVVLVCIGFCCSVPLSSRSLEREPLLAIASETYETGALDLSTQHESTAQNDQEASQEQAAEADGVDQKYRQEVYYVVDPAATHQGVAQNDPQAPQEYSAIEPTSEHPEMPTTGAEYPGEIVYLGQEPQSAQNNEGGDSISGFMEMISRSASLPATILTEVPVSQLPEHVLDKLKREYGVKVVATRENPGANLVINCDDYTTQESSFCQKPSTTTEDQAPQPHQTSPESGASGEPDRTGQEYQSFEQPSGAKNYYFPREDSSSSDATGESLTGTTSGDQAHFGHRNAQV